MQEYNRQTNEFGNTGFEHVTVNELKNHVEGHMCVKNVAVQESSTKSTQSKKSKGLDTGKILATILATTIVTTTATGALMPAKKANATMIDYGLDFNAFYFTVEVDSEVDLQAVIFNKDTKDFYELVNGENQGVFESLKFDEDYTFQIAYSPDQGDKVLFEHLVRPTVEYSVSIRDELGVELNSIYYEIETYSPAPLMVVVYNANERYEQEIMEEGVYGGVFENLQYDTEYTFIITYAYGLGDTVMAQRTIRTMPYYMG